jgi:hypothetical protein
VQYVGQIKKSNKDQYQSGEALVQLKPQISDKTSKLADNKRKRLLGDRPNASLVEILLIPKHNEQELEEKRKQLKDREVEGCTFKP